MGDEPLSEVIRQEGTQIVLYSKDGQKVLGRFPFGKGKRFKGRKEARMAAQKREHQIQFFKHQGERYTPSDAELHAVADHIGATILAEAGNVDGLIKSFGSWAGGSHQKCVAALKGVAGIESPEKLCAWLKDRYKGKTDWRGKESATEEAAGDQPVAEYLDPACSPSPVYGATSFADLDAAENAEDAAREVSRRTWQFQTIVGNIMADTTIEDKAAAIKTAADEFTALVAELLANPTEEPAEEQLKEGEIRFGESESGQAVAMIESAGDAPLVPMALKVQLVKPGKGNSRDKNYYPAEVLKRDAHIFEGVKMFETDHRENERSNRTWVSTVDQILEFDPTSGAPIARVVVHDPNFAERARALAAAGKLDQLECSILGAGLARPQKIDGEEWHVLESLVRAKAVDWVTKAGAGGHATAIAEGEPMPEKIPAAPPPTPTTTPPKPVAEAQAPATPPAQPVVVAEATPPAAPAQPVVLAEADVKRLVEATNLPAPARERLLAEHYADEKAVRDAIAREIEYVKKLTGSGQPFGLGGSSAAPAKLSEKEYDDKMKELYQGYGITLR